VPIVLIGGWMGIALVIRALELYTRREPEDDKPPDDFSAR